MLIYQLNKPSLAEIRANLITEQLKNLPHNSSYINIFVTGRSASGKTTLGNRLIGENYFLSTGRQNTTQVVNLIEFSGGFRFFDLPGVDGGGRQDGGRLENYNRAALGLSQFPSYPNVTEITIATYRKNGLPQEHTYKLNEFQQLPFKPHLVLYLIDPKKGLSRSEEDYARDLIEFGHNVIYVLNLWVDKYNQPLATKQNFEDTEKSIKEIHIELQKNKDPVIVKINCQIGQGIDILLQQASLSLGDARGSVFKQVIQVQHQKAPQRYIDLIKQELIKIFVDVACYEPSSVEDAKEKLNNTGRLLWNYLVDFSLHKNEDPSDSKFQKTIDSYSDFQKIINPLIKTVINSCKEDHYKPVAISIPFARVIYENVQLYDSVSKIVDDPEQPIYEKKVIRTDGGFLHYLQTGKWEKEYSVDEFTGRFGQKRVLQKIPSGTKKEFSHIDTWTELIGLKKYSYSTYNYFGLNGICFLQCLCLAIVNSNFQDKNQFSKYIYSYYSSLKNLTNINLFHENQYQRKEQLNNVLTSNINLILDQSFDFSAITAFVEVENPKTAQKYWQSLLFSILDTFATRLFFEINNYKALAIKIVSSTRDMEIFSGFGIQCLKLVAHYSILLLHFLWEICQYLRERFKG